ncbi:MAG: DUF2911 domain-containing protein [Gemmatimonadales bacterium]
MTTARTLAVLGALALVPLHSAAAQVKASEPASVTQTVDGTVITVTYSRPQARGRDTLFGGEVKWNEVWTPGANDATTLEVSKDIQLDGHPVAKGKYSVWLVIRRDSPWTLVLDPRAKLFHLAHPDSTVEQLRYDLAPGSGPYTEVLAWTFPDVRIGGTTLAMSWGTVRASFRIDVQPSYTLQVSPRNALPYVGVYDLHWVGSSGTDTTSYPFALTSRDGTLHGEWVTPPFPGAGSFALIPIHEQWFTIAQLRDGQVYDIMTDLTLEYSMQAGRAASFEMRDEKDAVIAVGKRQ